MRWRLALGTALIAISESALAAQAPSLVLDAGTLAFMEGDGVTTISPGATAADADGDWDGGTVTVQITAHGDVSDYLAIGNSLGVSVSSYDVIESGVTFGTLNLAGLGGQVSGSTAMIVTFNSSATDARVQRLVRSIAFNVATNAPDSSTRIVEFTLVDAAANPTPGTRAASGYAAHNAPHMAKPAGIPAPQDGA